MRLSRRIAITWPAVVIAVLIPAAVVVAAPTHPPDPASTARAIARHQAESFRVLRPIAPAAVVAAPAHLPDPASTARDLAGDRAASFRALRLSAPPAASARPIAAPVASARPAPARPDGPTWAAALVAGALAAAVAAGLGLMAGRRTARVRAG